MFKFILPLFLVSFASQAMASEPFIVLAGMPQLEELLVRPPALRWRRSKHMESPSWEQGQRSALAGKFSH